VGSFPSANPSLPTSVPGVYVPESALLPVPPLLPAFIAASSGQAHGAVTLAQPATPLVVGDLMLVAVEVSTASEAVPKGWTPVAPQPQIQAFNGTSQGVSLYMKVADAIDVAAANLGVWGSGNPTGVLMGFFRNPSGQGGWFQRGFAMTDDATGAAITVPPYYSQAANRLIVAAIASAGSATNAALTPPSDYTTIASLDGTGASFPFWMGYQFSAANAQIGPSSATAHGSVTFTWGVLLAAFGVG
jgi:hypothetical protein